MTLSVRDARHTLLVTLIVAALPMFIYPNALGMNFDLSLVWYIALELIYFFVFASFLNRSKAMSSVAVSAALYFGGRLILSFTLSLFILLLERTSITVAFGNGFDFFKPGLLFFTLVSPFLFNSTAQTIASGVQSTKRTRRVDPQIIRSNQQTSQPSHRHTVAPAITNTPRSQGEFFDRNFDEAVHHVGEYSGVLCSVLVDSEGLPVACWSRGEEDPEMWGALAKRIVDELDDINSKTGLQKLETLEFKTGGQRFSLHRVEDMWLLAIADAATDELEKIRVVRAAEMIARHCQERFKHIYITETGRTYAGSTF